MNRKYIDFVPKAQNVSVKPAAPRPVKVSVDDAAVKPKVHESPLKKKFLDKKPIKNKEVEVSDFDIDEIFSVKETKKPAGVTTEPGFGVFEDYQEKFVKADVAKRPLGDDPEVAKAKSKKIAAKLPLIGKKKEEKDPEPKKTSDKVLSSAVEKADDLDHKMKVPKPQFVNTERVAKRPLSKNVYSKKAVIPKEEEPSGPVTIIAKPEKDSKVGLIVTIIITIILGAAAGTVAFLLLPK